MMSELDDIKLRITLYLLLFGWVKLSIWVLGVVLP